MISTLVSVSLLAGLMLASIVLGSLFLYLGVRWAKAQNPNLRRCLLATCLSGLLQIPVLLIGYSISLTDESLATIIALINLILLLLIPVLVIRWVFQISLLRSFQAWLPTNLGAVMMFAFLFLIFNPFFLQAFQVSSNSMAPTLLGNHWQGTCAVCGGRAYCSPTSPEFEITDLKMICEARFHMTHPVEHSESVHSPDRFLVTKFLKPQRWDLVVFRHPEDPQKLYVMRIVGLPGEVMTIAEGKVHANGIAVDPPDSIREIRYTSHLENSPGDAWGSNENPATLDQDEYFVLGDFTDRSNDSRLWNQGAPGHHPYAVPASYITGVVTQIYWPPSRWKSFR